MKTMVFVEKIGKKKYRATTSQPVPLESEGASKDEALARLFDLAKTRLAAGQLVQLNIPDATDSNPWRTYAGIWKDHPDFDEFLQSIADNRRSVDAAENRA